MKHQRDIQCPASRGTVYVSYSALLVTKLTETSVALVYLYLIYSATGAFDLFHAKCYIYGLYYIPLMMNIVSHGTLGTRPIGDQNVANS